MDENPCNAHSAFLQHTLPHLNRQYQDQYHPQDPPKLTPVPGQLFEITSAEAGGGEMHHAFTASMLMPFLPPAQQHHQRVELLDGYVGYEDRYLGEWLDPEWAGGVYWVRDDFTV